jgi:hypothetical protein
VQSAVLNNFIQEIEIITGGYNAEFGRSTGGVVNVVTKTGSNEFHGSVWANVDPFEAKRDAVQSAATAIRGQASLATNVDFGFDVGGPIIKDKLWFYVGFAPFIQRTKITRIVSTNVDRNQRFFNYNNPNCTKNADGVTCDGDNNPATTPAAGCELMAANGAACEGDGRADVDAANNPIFEELDRSDFVASQTTYQFTGKLNLAITADHQGQLSFTGTPSIFHRFNNNLSSAPVLPAVNGTADALQADINQFIGDASFKWTSKFNNNKTQIDAVLGWHNWRQTIDGVNKNLPNSNRPTLEDPIVSVRAADLNGNTGIAIGRNWDQDESARVLQFCRDEASGSVSTDQFPRIRNCPLSSYLVGGPGIIGDSDETRVTGKVTLTQRVKALGHHQFKVGADLEVNSIADVRQFSGGTQDIYSGGLLITTGFAHRNDTGGQDLCSDPAGNLQRCDLVGQEGLPVNASTLNWAAFIQDSWSILPNLTINAGLRYEEQRVGIADQKQSTIDPITGQPVGSTGLKLSGLFAPRIGVIYDWTKEGRSKIYANWGRFYESVPEDINERAFGGETSVQQFWDASSQCGAPFMAPGADRSSLPSEPRNCPRSAAQSATGGPAAGGNLLGFGSPDAGIPDGLSAVVPGTTAQSLDEFVAGVEYEVLEDLRLGLSYQNRRLRTVVEDSSTDGGNTYYIGNPGFFSDSEEQNLLGQIMNASGTLKSQLIKRLTDFRALRQFDKPSRDYNAVQLTASKRFSRSFFVQGSYTYSRLQGNYPGLFQSESGQLDPNITSQYDLVELLGNRYGRLPGDVPHQFKLDGYYTFDMEKSGRITTGLSLRGQSGTLVEVIGAHRFYGATESWILPRDISGRTAFGATADVHVAYARRLGDVDLEVYVELFNVLNNQYETSRSNQYTLNNVHPIIGGDAEDLPHAKAYGAAGQGIPVVKNLNWDHTTGRALPLTGRFGLTISF